MSLKIPVKDRVPTYPGRVKMTPVSGQANTYDLVRADSPVDEGTPLNKALFDNKAYTVTENATVYVNRASGNDTTGNGTSTAPYASIQAAIDSIPKCLGGFVVEVDIAAGTYPERVRVEGFYGGRLIIGQADRTITVNGISVFTSTSVEFRISTVTAVSSDSATLVYVGAGSQVLVGRHMTLNCGNISTIGLGVEQNSSLSALGISMNVNGSKTIAILAKHNGRIALEIAGGSSNAGVGLRAENGSVITYVTKSLAAATATLTIGGGKIYASAQTSVPSY